MKMKFYFGQFNRTVYNNTTNMTKPNAWESDPDHIVLEYELDTNMTVSKFLECFRKTRQHENAYWHYNVYYYQGLEDENDLNRLQVEMNATIHRLNARMDVKVPDELVLQESADHQVEKLNALHRYFEDHSYRLGDSELYEWVIDDLEKVNQLVHKMEAGIDLDAPGFNYYTVTRLDCPDHNWIELDDNDYNTFELPHGWGDLMLSYATVGKDLWQCVQTDDVALLQAGEVKTQRYIKPYTELFFKERDENWTREAEATYCNNKFEKWCRANRVEDYGINWWEPQYRIGRAPLGRYVGAYSKRELENLLMTHDVFLGAEID